MKYFFIASLFCVNSLLYAQVADDEAQKFSISSGIGLGLLESHSGVTVDGQIDRRFDRLTLGIAFNSISTSSDVNALPDNSITTIDTRYLSNLRDYRHRSTLRQQVTVGFIIGYDVVSKERLVLNIGVGPTYNSYKMADLSINTSGSGAESIALASYVQRRQTGFSYQVSSLIGYRISDNIALGLRTRLIEFKDYNMASMLSLSLSI